jgi:hypothetical protein
LAKSKRLQNLYGVLPVRFGSARLSRPACPRGRGFGGAVGRVRRGRIFRRTLWRGSGRESCITLSSIGNNSWTPAPAGRGEQGCQFIRVRKSKGIAMHFPSFIILRRAGGDQSAATPKPVPPVPERTRLCGHAEGVRSDELRRLRTTSTTRRRRSLRWGVTTSRPCMWCTGGIASWRRMRCGWGFSCRSPGAAGRLWDRGGYVRRCHNPE